MSDEAWSCFARLPPGLVVSDPPLTLRWLRSRPTYQAFGLSRSDTDARRFAVIVAVQRVALVMLALIGVGAGVAFAIDLTVDRELLLIVNVIIGATAAVVALSAREILRYRQVEPRRQAFDAAVEEFAEIDRWRAERCDPAFWTRIGAAEFELEAAELLAGVFSTGQVTLTRETDDYGVDILACAPAGRIIAKCRASKHSAGPAEIRELGGAKAFFAADHAIMISAAAASHESEENRRLAERLGLAFWNAEALAGWARRLRNGP